MTDALAVVATIWGMLMGASPLLQIRRMRQRQSSADFSLGYFSVLLIGFVLWATYGVAIANPALIVSNSVSFLVGIATFFVAWRYRIAG